MNRSSQSMLISKSIDGFVKFKVAEGLSERTIISYQMILNQWVTHFGDRRIDEIKSSDLTDYLAWLRTEYKPKRLNGSSEPLAQKTLRNIWIVFRSFFGWLHKEFNYDNVALNVTAPKFQSHPVEVFTNEEVEKLLKACTYSRESETHGRRKFVMRRPSAIRDQAIILTLIDTGLRASELCSLRIADVDLGTGRVIIRHGISGGAKGGKGRTVFLGKVARKAVWRYLTGRDDENNLEAPLFESKDGRPFTRDSLRILITRIGSRANVRNAHPHKFRHTFAISYLRLGGDVFTLQMLLGHRSLEMVRHYAQIAEVDIELAHRKASPADNLHY